MMRFLPPLLFALSCVFLVFGAGVFVGEYKMGPYRFIKDGAKTLKVTVDGLTAGPYYGQFGPGVTDVARADIAASRFDITPTAAAAPGTILINGGLYEFREHCPDYGCIAIEVDRNGALIHAYPYRPFKIFEADTVGANYPREAVPADPRLIKRPLGFQQYPNGDLLVTFQSTGSMFPFAAGTARIDKEGNPVWFRFDYSHHWNTLLADGTALVPNLVVAEGDWNVPIGSKGARERLQCDTGRPQVDGFQLLGPDGDVITEVDVSAALRASPWSAMLVETTDACDPLHINYVDQIRTDASGGLEAGDYLISLRNLSAIAVIDKDDFSVKLMQRGSFVQQHSVQHLSGSKVLLFDNWGGDAIGPPSRLLEVDLATGAERRVFPLPKTGYAEDGLFSNRGSQLYISADRSRAMVSFSGEGRGFEVDIASGDVLLSYDSLHDMDGVDGVPEGAATNAMRANLYGMVYLNE